MPPRLPEPYIVHPLPAAPDFLGREAELDRLRAFWVSGNRGVLSLVGLGGAGKTAIAARFLSDLLDRDRPAGGVFVWSFYQEPDAGLFLRELFDYFGATLLRNALAQGAGLLHFLSEALQEGGRHLLVLDGLERVQRQAGDASYGQIEDPLLKSLLLRIAEGLGQTALLATSRFPLICCRADCRKWSAKATTHARPRQHFSWAGPQSRRPPCWAAPCLARRSYSIWADSRKAGRSPTSIRCISPWDTKANGRVVS